MSKQDIAIVLTGTIIPNSTFVVYTDPDKRRSEYLRAIQHYSQFAPVFFLENSSYDLEADHAFTEVPTVQLRKLPLSQHSERGKGYQEFEMLDAWLKTEEHPPARWIKVTGRYIYINFGRLFDDFEQERLSQIVIDQYKRTQTARTGIFGVNTEYYLLHLLGLYRESNDSIGAYIEKVYYTKHSCLPHDYFRIFSVEPDLTGISGTTGGEFGKSRSKYLAKSLLRKLNYVIDKHYIWYAR